VIQNRCIQRVKIVEPMIQTEAFVLKKKGSAAHAFQLENIQLPNPQPTQVVIDVEAFGLNYADVMARLGLYREAPKMPCVIGYEVVGKISAVGNQLDPSLIGQRVVSFCRFGGYAKKVIAESFAFSTIGDMETGKALALATQGVTAYYMAERLANVQSGDRVLIHAAAGGVGSLLIQLCKLKGAEIIAKVSSRDKEKMVCELGADRVLIYTEQDYATALQTQLKGERLDVSFNPVAGSTFKKDWKLLGSGGKMVLFGGSELVGGKWGLISTLNFVRKMGFVVPIGLMMRSKNIMGVNMLKIAENRPNVLQACLKAVIELAETTKLNPVIGGCYDSSDLNRAHDALEKGKSQGKLYVRW
jgi:NADPH:quinone reductase-like Zn-dependent oxidoreductase